MASTPEVVSAAVKFSVTAAVPVDEAPLLILIEPVGAVVSRRRTRFWVAQATPRMLLASNVTVLFPSEESVTVAVQVNEVSAGATSWPFT